MSTNTQIQVWAEGDLIPFFPLSRRFVDLPSDEILDALGMELRGGVFINSPAVVDFEDSLARYLGPSRCAVAVSNGLDALRLALLAWDVGPGDEVIVPAFTFVATWLAVLHVGATPVPVDVDIETALMDVDQVNEHISASTKAVIPVHLYGSAVDLSAARREWVDRGLLVLEDAAQAHGALGPEGRVGGQGQCSAFSFYPTKNLGALGDAGALVIDRNEPRIDRLRGLRNYGAETSKYSHIYPGFNARMDGIQARALLMTLPLLDEWNARRRAAFAHYAQALQEVESASLLQTTASENEQSARHLAVVRSHLPSEVLQGLFAQHAIETSQHYPYSFDTCEALRLGSAQFPRSSHSNPNSDYLAGHVVSLPLHPWLKESEIERICLCLEQLDDLTRRAS